MIVIIDFGSQTAHLIGRRLRQLGVATTYVDPEHALQVIAEKKPTGIILSGGPASVYAPDAPTVDPKLFTLNIPILGICYGWQLMAHLTGGEVSSATKEYGPETVSITQPCSLFQDIPAQFTAILSHGDSVTKLPPGFAVVGQTPSVPYTAVINTSQRLFGIQFHPEAEHTEQGMAVLRNFSQLICHETLTPIVLDPQTIIDIIRSTVGDRTVIMAVSGGVDSTVAAFLIGKAIGKQLLPVYVESGLMRPQTHRRVKEIFKDNNVIILSVKDRFMKALAGITDPEIKRKTIGKLYIDLFDEVAAQHPEAQFLGQGTIYSDVIESQGSTHASRIKSHHNVGGLPENMKLQLLEPLRQYYKDEVRELGRLAGLPEDVIAEHPFPGPGYAVYIRGEVTEKRLNQVIQADTILVEELKQARLYSKAFQCFAVMTGAYSTAVKGDERAFAEVVALRIFETNDIMTGTWMQVPYEILGKISTRIVNEVPDVSRVVYDISNKPPATITWE